MHIDDQSKEESPWSDEENDEEKTDKEGLLEVGDDHRDNRGKHVVVCAEELGEEDEDVQTVIAHSLADMVAKATTTTTYPSSSEASSSQVHDLAPQMAKLPTLVSDTTIQ